VQTGSRKRSAAARTVPIRCGYRTDEMKRR
jgi:hypothetical protein